MRKIMLVLVAFLLVALMTNGIWAAREVSNGWLKFADDQYQLIGELDGELIFVRLENQNDYRRVMDVMETASVGHKLRGRHAELPAVAFKGLSKFNDVVEVESRLITIPYHVTLPRDLEPQRELFIREISRNGKKILVTERESGSVQIFADPKGKKFVFNDENLWILDSDTMTVKQLTSDKVGSFNRLEMIPALEAKSEDHFLHWTNRPSWNVRGNIIVFETNRTYPATSGMDIWTVDLVTGEEKHVLTGKFGLQTLGWVDEENLIYEERTLIMGYDRWDIKKANVVTGESTLLLMDVRFLGMSNSMVIYGKETGGPLYEVYAMDMQGNSHLISKARNNFMFDHAANFSPDGTKVILTSRNMQGRQMLTMVNLLTMDSKELQGPWGQMMISDPIWLDNYRIMVQTESDNPAHFNRTSTWIYQF